jgi:uncharacterized MAPEG superfamily protein
MESVPYWCLVIAGALIYAPRQVATYHMWKQPGGYDNEQPRRAQAKLEGIGQRAVAAHLNGFEAFAPFAAGVLAAIQRGVDRDLVAWLCLAFVGFRTLYVLFYLANQSTLRSTSWVLGISASSALLFLAAIG